MSIIQPTPDDLAEYAPERRAVVMDGIPMVITRQRFPEPAQAPPEEVYRVRLVASFSIEQMVEPLGEDHDEVEP